MLRVDKITLVISWREHKFISKNELDKIPTLKMLNTPAEFLKLDKKFKNQIW